MSGLNLLASYDTDSNSEPEPESATSVIKTPEQRDNENHVPASRSFFSASASDTTDSDEESVSPQDLMRRAAESSSLVNPFRQDESSKKDTPAKPTEARSVFSNPFTAAELAEKSALEKHVKLAPRLEDVTTINGRRICWNYRKGRCRFGVNCVYAHDSEIIGKAQKREWDAEPSESSQLTGVPLTHREIELAADEGKKRPGLTDGLVPGKKVMKMYHKQKGQL